MVDLAGGGGFEDAERDPASWTPDYAGDHRKEPFIDRPIKYPDQFRKDTLELIRTSQRPIAEVAGSLEVAEGTLWNWVRADRDANAREGDPDASSESERDELRRLRKENIELQTDKEIFGGRRRNSPEKR